MFVSLSLSLSLSLLPQDDEDVGGAPPRATFSAPSDLLNDVPPNDQVRV